MTKVAIVQSNYIPWKGYFHIIQKADHFVFLDTAQYTKRDWRNRNRIKSPNDLLWLTVPTNGTQSRSIREVKVDNSSSWFRDHLRSLRSNYARCRFFDLYDNFLKNIYLGKQWEYLWEMNQFLIKEICKILEIDAEFHNSCDLELKDDKNEKIISMIKQLNGDHYITGPAARGYLTPELFEQNGIELEYMDYSGYPEYDQPWGEFHHEVSIFDLMFCVGPEAPDYIWGS